MNAQMVKKIKLGITIAIIFCFVWFLIISPMNTFHENEKKLEKAARRYFELNHTQLPTGERIQTVSLQTLYHKSFIEGDLFIPYTTKTCSVSDSWVKVRKENGEYKYYVYLQCGILSSHIDHKGPEIHLNGDEEMTVGVGEKYKEPGVRSVVDDNDGKIKIEDVTIKGSVDTSKTGSYEITYTAFDSFNNKSTVTRTVTVVQKFRSTVKKLLKDTTNFTGLPTNNYVMISNMLFRIYGLDSNNNVIIVADEDVANVNHTKLDKWLDYYYNDCINDKAKKMIIKAKYCNMELTDTSLDTTQCSSYTNERYVYIPSAIEVNKANTGEGNFMKPNTMSWVANKKSGGTLAYLTRSFFFDEAAGQSYMSFDEKDNYGVRPMMTLKGGLLITGGNGSFEKPFVFGDTKKARSGSMLNERYTGEYFKDSGTIWRIIKKEEDGTIKAISNNSLRNYTKEQALIRMLQTTPYPTDKGYLYNPKNKNSVAYYINNTAVGYVDTSKIVNHDFSVPIYKKRVVYGDEKETKTYKAILSAPDMYEIFSAQPNDLDAEYTRSYWLKNSVDSDEWLVSYVTDIGVAYTESLRTVGRYGVRVVAYFKADTVVINGSGTLLDPYVIK